MPSANIPVIPQRRETANGAIRLRLVDEKTNKPAAGVVVSIFADAVETDSSRGAERSSRSQNRLVGTGQSDHTGYVKVVFAWSAIGAGARLRITHGAMKGDALVLAADEVLRGNVTHTIHLDASVPGAVTPYLGLPAVASPDVQDLAVSPGSIGYIPHLLPGRGLCGQLMPTTMAIRRFEAFHVLADICNAVEVSCPEQIQIVEGKMLVYEIAWNPAGTALGHLLNTITLAPCEHVNIAVVDWMRSETTSQTEATDLQQYSMQETDHSRLITETMQSSVKNKSFAWAVGGSFGAGSGKSVGLTGKVLNLASKLDLTAAFGGGLGGSKTLQQTALNTTSQFSEHITQAASSVSSRRSSMVYQTTASEHQTYQTRTIRNHNHCRTVTFAYYQVNTNYEVVTRCKGVRDVILVRYESREFDAERAYCNAHLLKDALLDPSLSGCFDELADALFCCDLDPASANQDMRIDSLVVTVKPKEVHVSLWMWIDLFSATGGQLPLATSDAARIDQWVGGGVFTHSVNLSQPVDAEQVAWMQIRLSSGGSGNPSWAILNEIEVIGHGPGHSGVIIHASQTQTSIQGSLRTPVEPKLPSTQTAVKNQCIENSCCIRKLLGHLNCHERYYNTMLWLNEDPNERVMRWSCCRNGDAPFSLIDQIENEPITVYGDYLVFPVAGSEPVPVPSVLPVSTLVTMPTPGVYSEGLLGQCTTCEKVDPDRYWNWKDSPCPDSAPAVEAPASPQSSIKPGDLKADAISSLISFSNVSSDPPDSLLKDLLSTLVTKADGGSNEAKAMLEKLLEQLLEKVK